MDRWISVLPHVVNLYSGIGAGARRERAGTLPGGVHRRIAGSAAALTMAISLASCGTTDPSRDRAATPSASAAAPQSTGSAAAPTFPLRSGERVLSLRLPHPYRPKAPHGGTDDYRCFLLDPHLTASAFITGIGFVPGNSHVVHHAILFRVPARQIPAAEAKDAQQPGDGWTCFGDTEIPDPGQTSAASGNGGWLAAWAPGGRPVTYQNGLGVPVDAGSRVVLQVHYNLLGGNQPDQTGLRLHLTPAASGMQPLDTVLLPAPVELPCTAAEHGRLCQRNNAVHDVAARFGPQVGATAAGLQRLCGGNPTKPAVGATQSCDQRVPAPMTVQSAAGHMHLLGRSIRITLDPDTPRERILLDVPRYDFDNQGAVPLPQPVHVRPGNTIRVTCTHDAKLRAMLPELAHQPPRYVVWGDGTSDEMCLGILTVTQP
ncbi:MAG: monooxygenase [Frankiaceae bacterium]